ncbi:hypothetical protein BD413DRAFT_610496 [Trametes elegans]|nr:hypothetical protein BD413DRAFT_610496 [Trametes elegans]
MPAFPVDLDSFFGSVALGPSPLSPARLPGITAESRTALLKALRDNHVKWHTYFNDEGMHNHAAHHLVAIYALGASGRLLEAAYHTHVVYMKPAIRPPNGVTESTFWAHLEDEQYYDAYLHFFRDLLGQKSVSEVLEEYIFSPKANVGDATTGDAPKMLLRFLATIVHPLIHTGCGLEFGILGLVAEGLAQTCAHPPHGEAFLPTRIYRQNDNISAIDSVVLALNSLSLNHKSATTAAAASSHASDIKTGVHAFDILAKILRQHKYSPAGLGFPLPEDVHPFVRVEERLAGDLAALTDEWAVELDAPDVSSATIAAKIEELAWMNALLYGVGGWSGRDRSEKQDKKFNADFFFMHLVTSSVFLPSIVAYLSPRSAALLLRSYFTVSIVWYVAQGRPTLPIRDFYAHVTAYPAPPGASESRVVPAPTTLTPDDPAPNPWLPIVQTTLVHPSEHLCKLQRALLHDATLYGARAPGEFAGTGLEGAELLDGTLFVRAAGLTAHRMGWMREGQEIGDWDRPGFA